ncbi:MAG: hypothetical protein Q8P42_02080 [Gallionella sp.]|nr:hypothetical protein [Gallionella sp.]
MRYWRVLVKPGDGTQFFTRAVEISAHRAIVRGGQALPAGVVCDLHIFVPPPNSQQPPAVVGLRAEVGAVVFASGDIRLEFRVKSLSDEAQQLIDSRRLG